MSSPTLNDLRYIFYGAGGDLSVSDAEYNFLKAAYAAGVDANDLLLIGSSVDSAGTIRLTSSSYGFHYNDAGSTAGRVAAYSDDPSTIVFIARGRVGQTGDLFQFQDSAGTVLSKVDSAGTIFSKFVIIAQNLGAIGNGSGLQVAGGQSAATPVATLQGLAAQTADLLRLQSSAGATLLAVAAAGHLTFSEGINIIAGTATGTKIGTATTQKLGFFNKTPIVQPGAIASPTSDALGTKAAIDAIRAALTNLGLTA